MNPNQRNVRILLPFYYPHPLKPNFGSSQNQKWKSKLYCTTSTVSMRFGFVLINISFDRDYCIIIYIISQATVFHQIYRTLTYLLNRAAEHCFWFQLMWKQLQSEAYIQSSWTWMSAILDCDDFFEQFFLRGRKIAQHASLIGKSYEVFCTGFNVVGIFWNRHRPRMIYRIKNVRTPICMCSKALLLNETQSGKGTESAGKHWINKWKKDQ